MEEGQLAVDAHVHTQWSWDAASGDMEESCRQALRIGLRGLAFTEHADFTPWHITDKVYERLSPRYREMVSPERTLTPPRLDTESYLAAIEKCRHLFPDLRILSGVEIGEPTWHVSEVAELRADGGFDRVLASSHSIKRDGASHMVGDAAAVSSGASVLSEYLVDLACMVESSDQFEVLAHIDYPLRDWPADEPFNIRDFEDSFREVLEKLSASDRVLEINTVMPLDETILRWWADSGGVRVSFGSDAHDPSRVGLGIRDAMAMADSAGFRSRLDDPFGYWFRG